MLHLSAPSVPMDLAERLANPMEVSAAAPRESIAELAEKLLALMEKVSELGCEEADQVQAIEHSLIELVESGRPDLIGANEAFKQLRVWFTSKLSDLESDWYQLGQYEADRSNTRGPRCFR